MTDSKIYVIAVPNGFVELPADVFRQHFRPHVAPVAAEPALQEHVELVDAEAAAERFQLPKSWLLERARQGKIPHRRIGRYVRFSPSELSAWLKTDYQPEPRAQAIDPARKTSTRYRVATATTAGSIRGRS